MFRGDELRGRMREWALAWHADFVRANPEQTWAVEPTDLNLESIYACGLGDGSATDRRRRLTVVPGGASLIERVERIAVARKVCEPAPSDDEAIALVRRGIDALRDSGAYSGGPPSSIRVVRGPIDKRRRPLDAEDLLPRMRRAASTDTREVIGFLTESIYHLSQASFTLTEWALWPLVYDVMGPCPVDASFELWERGASVAYDDHDIVVRLPDEGSA